MVYRQATGPTLHIGTNPTQKRRSGPGKHPRILTGRADVMPVTIGPCAWNIPDPDCCTKWTDDLDQAAKDRAKRLAAWLLWTATGRQLGRCETTLRPCRRGCNTGGTDWPVRPDGRTVGYGRWMAVVENPASTPWAGVMCGCGRHACSCNKVCEIHLPGVAPEPVRVRVGAEEIPLSSFRVDSGHWLVWQAVYDPVTGCSTQPACFPVCQDLSLPPGSPGTWEVTYSHGLEVPQELLDVAPELVCEVVKACSGASPSECRLPSNVVSMTRNGVEFQFGDNTGTVTNATGRILRFNIPAVDMMVQSINPYGVTDVVRAWSPDMPGTGRIQTWP